MNDSLVEVSSCKDDSHSRNCPRCWKWHGVIENYDDLCDRCQQAILIDHPNHVSVPGIKAALDEQRKKYLRSSNQSTRENAGVNGDPGNDGISGVLQAPERGLGEGNNSG